MPRDIPEAHPFPISCRLAFSVTTGRWRGRPSVISSVGAERLSFSGMRSEDPAARVAAFSISHASSDAVPLKSRLRARLFV